MGLEVRKQKVLNGHRHEDGVRDGLRHPSQPTLVTLPGMRGDPQRLLANPISADLAFSAARAAEIIRYVRLRLDPTTIESAIAGFDKGVAETMHHLFSGEPGTDPKQAKIRATAILTTASEAYQDGQ